MRRHGFTLVEVLVALVVLEVGLLGVVGTLLLGARTLRSAERLEWAAAEVQRVYDSLSSTPPAPGEGRLPSAFGEVRWKADGQGRVRLEFFPEDSTSVEVVVEGLGHASRGVW